MFAKFRPFDGCSNYIILPRFIRLFSSFPYHLNSSVNTTSLKRNAHKSSLHKICESPYNYTLSSRVRRSDANEASYSLSQCGTFAPKPGKRQQVKYANYFSQVSTSSSPKYLQLNRQFEGCLHSRAIGNKLSV